MKDNKTDIQTSRNRDLFHFNGGKEARDKGAVKDQADIIQIWYLGVAGRGNAVHYNIAHNADEKKLNVRETAVSASVVI